MYEKCEQNLLKLYKNKRCRVKRALQKNCYNRQHCLTFEMQNLGHKKGRAVTPALPAQLLPKIIT